MALNEVGKASGGFVQPVAPSSSNMSPWGLTSTRFKPIFINFQTFLDDQVRDFGNSFRKNEFLVASLAKVPDGK